MVLQRDAPIQLWGWASPTEAIRIEFHGSTRKTQADSDGRWSTTIGPFVAGGPYEMRIKGANRIALHDILIGDVWLASGQSNMEMIVGGYGGYPGVENAPAELLSADYPKMRLFKVKRAASVSLRDDVTSSGWRAATPASVSRFSAVAYFFGRELHERYQIPIGIIESDWGGTFAESWMSKSALARFPDLRAQADAIDDRAKLYYETILAQKRAWYEQHGLEDRGIAGWASPEFDAHSWETRELPFAWGTKNFNGFGGVAWFRRELSVPQEVAGCDLLIQLGFVAGRASTFWNGVQLDRTTEGANGHVYVVPGQLVHPGRSVIAIRAMGSYIEDTAVGPIGPAESMKISTCTGTLPLSGPWSVKTGPDLQDFPAANPTTYGHLPPWAPPTVLFNGMIHPLRMYRIKGTIWYQGESNAVDKRSTEYRTLFPALIGDWRTSWGYDFPFLFVQLAGLDLKEAPPSMAAAWVEVREAQNATLSVPNTGMASAIDVGEAHDIHPKNKQEVGHRLALVAQKVAYGDNVVSSGPVLRSIRIEGDEIRIRYSDVGSGLLIKDDYRYVRGFEIAAADGQFMRAHARVDGPDVLVYHESIRQPAAVRYDWSPFPDGNVFNKEGLPALPFQTNASEFSQGSSSISRR